MKAALREEALQLPVEERARLARELIDSLDGPSDSDAEQTWLAEIERRVQEVQSGTAKLIGWDEVRSLIEARLRSR